MIDEEDQDEIINYFKGCETLSLQVAQKNYQNIILHGSNWKIMRIKFLAQYGM